MGTLRIVVALIVIAAATPAAAEPWPEPARAPMTPRTAVGWQFGLAFVRVDPEREVFSWDLALHAARSWHGVLWRAEGHVIAEPAGARVVMVGGVARIRVAETLSCGFKCHTYGLYADAGAGWLWYAADDRRSGSPSVVGGLSVGMASTPQLASPWKPWFQMSFGLRVYAIDHGHAIAGGLELSWMR